MHSVVKTIEATEAALINEDVATFAGSITPALTISPNSLVTALNPKVGSFFAATVFTTQPASTPEF